ncbi:hypothetical protein FACS189449_06550 [Alphaproteobacteria bacterium]|nr:hypothetical protein FACS189449_06550 [Alphaproteobacteria bacterium]
MADPDAPTSSPSPSAGKQGPGINPDPAGMIYKTANAPNSTSSDQALPNVPAGDTGGYFVDKNAPPEKRLDAFEAMLPLSEIDYKGDCNSEGKPHGLGVQRYKNGDVFKGSWKNGLRDGIGILKNKNGEVLRAGLWKIDNPVTYKGSTDSNGIPAEGKGTMTWPDGTTWTGRWQEGDMYGDSVIVYPAGNTFVTYTGKTDKDRFNGQGCLKYSNGKTYDGVFANGMREGLGKLTDKDGKIEKQGYWSEDKYSEYVNCGRYVGPKDELGRPHGKGKMSYDSGQQRVGRSIILYNAQGSYGGNWTFGRRDGHGTMKYLTGSQVCSYAGNWRDDQWNGYGTAYYYNGAGQKNDKYTGDYVDGRRQGKGKQTYNEKNDEWVSYDGEWDNDRWHGNGTLIFRNGEKYTGNFVTGEMCGTGKYTFSKKGIFTFSDGKIDLTHIKALAPSNRELQDAFGKEGICYCGEWIDGKMNGYGALEDKDGNVLFEGTWKNDTAYRGKYDQRTRTGQGTAVYLAKDCKYTTYTGNWLAEKWHGMGTLKFVNGDEYTGYFANGEMQGHGIYSYSDDRTFEGEWLAGKKEGPGVLKSPDCVVMFSGQWKADKMEGSSTIVVPNESTYEGISEGGVRNVYGVLTYRDGRVYEGQWKEGKPEGYGVYKYSDGRIYAGEWNADKRCGKGTLTWPKGKEKYVGDWVNDKFEGNGVRTYADGKVYEGQWKANKRHGKGAFELPGSGVKYVGDWVNDVREGDGKQTYADRKVYQGHFKGDKKDGKGILTSTGGEAYDGNWAKNLRDGDGKLSYADGRVYEGQFRADKRHGKGIMIWPAGHEMKKYVGEWVNDSQDGDGLLETSEGTYEGHFKADKRDGKGKMSYAEDGSTYVGEWVSNLRDGTGTLTTVDGKSYNGHWKKDAREGTGTMTWPDGKKFVGKWQNNARHEGVETDKDGKVPHSGIWKNGEFVDQ